MSGSLRGILIALIGVIALAVWMLLQGDRSRSGVAPGDTGEQEAAQSQLATQMNPPSREPADQSEVEAARKGEPVGGVDDTTALLAWIGQIQDVAGAHLAGARVEVSLNAHTVSALSDDDGAWTVTLKPNTKPESVQRETAGLVVSKKGYQTDKSRILCSPSSVVHVPTVTLLTGGSITGRVVDQDGWAIASARVAALKAGHNGYARKSLLRHPDLNIGDAPIAVVQTDDEGRFEFRGLPLGVVDLWGQAPQYEPRLMIDERVGSSEPGWVDITLAQIPWERSISGTVVSASGILPRDVTVQAAKAESDSLAWDRRTWVAEDGSFCLALDEVAPHDIRVVDPWAPRTLASLQDVAPGTKGLVLRILPGPAIQVAVTDTAGSPIAGATLDLVLPRDGSNVNVTQAETSTDGSAQLPMISDELFAIKARAHGFHPASSGPHAPGSDEMHLSITLEAGPALRGMVLDEDGPAADATIELMVAFSSGGTVSAQPVLGGTPFHVQAYPKAAAVAQSGHDGSFVVTVPRAREYVLLARRGEEQSARLFLGRILPDSDMSGLKLRLERPGMVRGQLLLPDGPRSLVGQIVAVSDGSGVLRAQPIGPEAEYSFQLPAGDWQIRACPSGLASVTVSRVRPARDGDPLVPEWDFHIASGEVTHVDVDLREAGSCSVSGSFMWGEAPMDGWRAALLDVRTKSMPITLSRDAVSLTSSGEFALEAAQPGTYLLRIWNQETDVLHRIAVGVGEGTWRGAVQTAHLRVQGIPPLTIGGRKYAIAWTGNDGLQVFQLAVAGEREGPVRIEVPAGSLSILSTDGPLQRGFLEEGWRRDVVLTVAPGDTAEVVLGE